MSAPRIVGEGTGEVQWSSWLDRLSPPPLEVDTLLGSTQRLVVVSPHPDDEVLACGGLIARHAAHGGQVAIVAVTDGEASHRGDPAWPSALLANERRHERNLGLRRLGIDAEAVTLVALADSDVTAGRSALEEVLAGVLRSGDCVVSTWQGDGHPDHDATGAVTAGLCAELGCQLLEAPVWMWHWSAPDDPRVPWQRLRACALSAELRACKAAALAHHRTQLAPRVDAGPVLGPAILARSRRESEYFFV